jgi:hypothetical protein
MLSELVGVGIRDFSASSRGGALRGADVLAQPARV